MLGPSHSRPARLFLLAMVTLLSVLHWIPRAFGGDWSYAQHDAGGTARSDATGAISGDATELPGQSLVLSFDETSLNDVNLYDTNGDGTPDLITPLRGKIVALSGIDGAVIWSTPLLRASDLEGVYDLDGDGLANELIATYGSTTGGLYVVDRDTGGLLWEFTEASNRGGVAGYDVSVADIDDDGAQELFFAEWLYGNDYIYFADFSWGFSDVELIQLELPGSYKNYTPSVGGSLWGSAQYGGFMTQQSTEIALFQLCDPGDADAVCSPTGLTCMCTRESFIDVHASFSTGMFQVQDIDGDDVDEVLEVFTHTRYRRAVYVLDVADGYSTGAAVTDDLVQWSRDYGEGDTFIIVSDDSLNDLDGDGDPDLLLTFYNNIDTELDHTGALDDDGINHPDGFSTGVFDAATGDLVFELLDTFAYGSADLDGDGTMEIITSPTTGWTFEDGLYGVVLDCTGNCIATTVWGDATHTMVSNLSTFDDADWPDAEVLTMDADGDGAVEMLVYDGAWLDAVEIDGGGFAVQSSVFLATGEDVSVIEDLGSYLLLYDGVQPRLFDARTSGVGPYLSILGQAIGEARAAILDPNDPRATLIVNGSVFYSVAAPASMSDADIEMQPNVAFAEDLTGDGFLELVSWAQPADDPEGDLVIEVYSFNPADPDGDGTPFGLLWSFDSDTVAELSGFEVTDENGHAVRMMDWNDDGLPDVLFSTYNATTWNSTLLVFDGMTGTLLELLPVDFMGSSQRVSQYMPIWITDLDDPGGSGSPDGTDDIVLADYRYKTILPGGGTTATVRVYSDVYHSEGAIGDMDGDGVEDYVAVYNGGTSPNLHVTYLSTSFDEMWPATDMVSLPSGGDESVALIDAGVDDGLDIAYVSGSGSLDVYIGDTGELLAGFPVYLADGEMLAGYEDDTPAMQCVAVADIDGDGYEEALVGDYGGYLYAVNVDSTEAGSPSLEWSLFFDAPVKDLAVADIDGDGAEEIIVATQDSTVRIVDGIGADIDIQVPETGSCLGTPTVIVSGTASMVELVDVYMAGVLRATDVAVVSDSWTADAFPSPSYGSWQIVAVGKDASGRELVYDQVVVMVDGDADGDGWTLCGGDCDDTDASLNLDDADGDGKTTCDGDCDDDDPMNYPGNEEICDGQDNDCDGDVDEGFDADEDGYRTCDGDCADGDPDIHPGAQEICGDGIDSDCDGSDGDCDDYYGDDDGDNDGGGCDCSLPGLGTSRSTLTLIVLICSLVWTRRRPTS